MSNKLISQKQTLELIGGWNRVTLWKELQKTESVFPKPLRRGRRLYFSEKEIQDWISTQLENRETAA